MPQKTVAEIIVDTPQAAGVKRVFGVVGDSLNGIADAIRTREGIAFVAVRHEEGGLGPATSKNLNRSACFGNAATTASRLPCPSRPCTWGSRP